MHKRWNYFLMSQESVSKDIIYIIIIITFTTYYP